MIQNYFISPILNLYPCIESQNHAKLYHNNRHEVNGHELDADLTMIVEDRSLHPSGNTDVPSKHNDCLNFIKNLEIKYEKKKNPF